MERVEAMKWAGTGLILTGILLTNLDQYPMNIFFHGAGVLFWSTAGLRNFEYMDIIANSLGVFGGFVFYFLQKRNLKKSL